MDDCVFCKIVKGGIPSKKVYEDGDVLAFYDIHPIAPVHVLVIPKKHIAKLSEAQEEDENLLGKLQLVAAKTAKDLKIDDAFRVSLSNGKGAGQEVFHIHYHLRGGWEGEAPAIS
jgi:histidine triad (HIT) family protein